MANGKKNAQADDNEDIHDSQRDIERLKPEETTMDLPDVKDIPGQEFIHVPRLGELADTTISSDDEEGKDIFDDEDNNQFSGEDQKDTRKNDTP